MNLHRSKVDGNRSLTLDDGTSAEGAKAWNATHELLEVARQAAPDANQGRGLLIDVHGTGDPTKGLQLGYVVPGSVLNSYTNAELNLSGYAPTSSIAALGRDSVALGGNADFARVLRGDLSLGTMLASLTDFYGDLYYAPPSEQSPGPGANNYFSGGYITQRYGSGLSTGTVALDAIQLEVTSHYRQKSDAAKSGLARDLAGALSKYMQLNYGFRR